MLHVYTRGRGKRKHDGEQICSENQGLNVMQDREEDLVRIQRDDYNLKSFFMDILTNKVH